MLLNFSKTFVIQKFLMNKLMKQNCPKEWDRLKTKVPGSKSCDRWYNMQLEASHQWCALRDECEANTV